MGIGFIPAAGVVAGELSGFGIYLATTTGLGAISSAIGVTFPWAVYQGATTLLGVMLGPIGWALAGAGVVAGGIVFLSQWFKRNDQKLTTVVIAIIIAIGDNPYEWFGFEETAPFTEVRQAYRAMMKTFHPDLLPKHLPDWVKQRFNEFLLQTQENYEQIEKVPTRGDIMTTTAQTNTFELFLKVIKKWLIDLGVNAQLFIELAGDGALPMWVRYLAAGVLLYLNVRVDLIPEKLRFIGLIDDVLVMIVGLGIIVPQIPEERLKYYRQKYEAVGQIGEYEQIMKSTLGILWERLTRFVETLQKRTYKNKTTEEVAQSAELREELFDETMVFVANLGLDPETLDKETKLLPSPEKVMGLLSSGLEEAQKRDKK